MLHISVTESLYPIISVNLIFVVRPINTNTVIQSPKGVGIQGFPALHWIPTSLSLLWMTPVRIGKKPLKSIFYDCASSPFSKIIKKMLFFVKKT
jgi:hypothetical protein